MANLIQTGKIDRRLITIILQRRWNDIYIEGEGLLAKKVPDVRKTFFALL